MTINTLVDRRVFQNEWMIGRPCFDAQYLNGTVDAPFDLNTSPLVHVLAIASEPKRALLEQVLLFHSKDTE